MKPSPYIAALTKLSAVLKDLSYAFGDGSKQLAALKLQNPVAFDSVRAVGKLLRSLGEVTYQTAWDIDGHVITFTRAFPERPDASPGVSRSRRPKRTISRSK